MASEALIPEDYDQRLRRDLERQMDRPGVTNRFKPARWCDLVHHTSGGYALPQEPL